MRRVVALLTALALAAGWFVVTAPSGGAAGTLETAWWWQGEVTTGAVPPPPTVPDGGLWVSSNASGTQSLSAVRVSLNSGEAAPTLTLDIHQSVPPNEAELVAYPTSTAWPAGPAHAWSSKPAYDPSGVHAGASVSNDGKRATFDLSGLVSGDVLNVVIAPAPAAAPPPAPLPGPPPGPPTFDVTFEKVGPANLHVSSEPAALPDESASAAASAPSPPQDVTPLPGDSISQGTPVGLSAPLPAVATAPTPARAAPQARFRNAPRLFGPASAKRSLGDSAAIAVMLGIVLLWVARDTAASRGLRLPRLSLYDAPKPADALAMHRTGSPPPLR